KRCDLVLVADLERGRVDFDRLVTVLRESLQSVGWAAGLLRMERCNAGGHGKRRGRHRHPAQRNNAPPCAHGPRETETSAGTPEGADCCGADRDESWVSVISTPPPKTTTAPFSFTSSRLAFSKPSGSFTSTGLSETILPLPTLTVASDKCPS